MRILHHALSDLTCRIGGCLVPLEQTDNWAPRGDAIQSEQPARLL